MATKKFPGVIWLSSWFPAAWAYQDMAALSISCPQQTTLGLTAERRLRRASSPMC